MRYIILLRINYKCYHMGILGYCIMYYVFTNKHVWYYFLNIPKRLQGNAMDH